MAGSIVGGFDTREEAERAVDLLVGAGFTPDAVSLRTGEPRPLSSEMPVEEDQQMANEPVTGAAAGGVLGGAVGATVGGPVGLAAGLAAGGALGAVIGKSVAGGVVDPETKDTEAREAGRYLVVVHAGERESDARSILTQANASIEPPEHAAGQAP